ncbi:MAG: HlyC/CorC family transporter [Lachnospiraceae bacterium]|nr:HlyC/CorC family transporter [Lachnospiraceae bacterium]
MDNPYIGILMIFIFILIVGILNSFRGALSELNESLVEKLGEKKQQKAKCILHILDNPERLEATVFLLVFVMSLFFACFMYGDYVTVVHEFFAVRVGRILTGWFMDFFSHALVIAYMLLLLCVLAIFVPFHIGKKRSESVSFGTIPIVRFFIAICSPFTGILCGLAKLIVWLLGIHEAEKEEDTTEEEIKSMVNEGHEKGVIEASEAEMISNIFEFGDKMAKDIMTHRKNIVAVDGEMTLAEAVEYILEENNSRYPVYVDDIDNIIGILHLKTAVIFSKQQGMSERKLKDIPELLHEAFFIPETRNINTLFRDMQFNKIHMEIVVDEYGQTVGLIAMEDILEVIVGSILDEYDEEENFITACEDGTYLVDGMTTLEDLEDTFGLVYDEEDIDTLNGFLISKLDRILSEDDKPEIEVDGCKYQVLSVENKMISLVRLTLPEVTEDEEDDTTDDKQKTKESSK